MWEPSDPAEAEVGSAEPDGMESVEAMQRKQRFGPDLRIMEVKFHPALQSLDHGVQSPVRIALKSTCPLVTASVCAQLDLCYADRDIQLWLLWDPPLPNELTGWCQQVRKLLRSCSATPIHIRNANATGDAEMTALQQKRLMALAVRTMALPCGRAAFTLGEAQQCMVQACLCSITVGTHVHAHGFQPVVLR